MKKIAAFAASLAFATLASAQANSFGGFSVGLNANMITGSSELTAGSSNVKGLGQQTLGASLQAAYGFAVSNTAVMSVGFTYSLADIDGGQVSDPAITGGTIKFKAKNVYSVYFEPGFNVSPSTLAYAKISYDAASASYDAAGTSDSKNIDGAGLGVGLRTMLTKNAYLQVEARQVQYNSARFANSTADFKSSATYGTVGIGYKF